MHPHLVKLREQYDQLRSSIDTIQTRAVNENRDLTETEQKTVDEQTALGKTLYAQIEDLTEHETRTLKVAKLAADLEGAQTANDATQTRAVGGAKTRDRDPGIYVRGGEN